MGKPALHCSSQKRISLLSWRNMALVSIGSVAFRFWERFVHKLLLNFSNTISVPPSE